jgi:hypothetical protein
MNELNIECRLSMLGQDVLVANVSILRRHKMEDYYVYERSPN